MIIACTVCASPNWFACHPGTAPDASRYPNIPELTPTDETPILAWCTQHWPPNKGKQP